MLTNDSHKHHLKPNYNSHRYCACIYTFYTVNTANTDFTRVFSICTLGSFLIKMQCHQYRHILVLNLDYAFTLAAYMYMYIPISTTYDT